MGRSPDPPARLEVLKLGPNASTLTAYSGHRTQRVQWASDHREQGEAAITLARHVYITFTIQQYIKFMIINITVIFISLPGKIIFRLRSDITGVITIHASSA